MNVYCGRERSNALRLIRLTEPPIALAGESGFCERETSTRAMLPTAIFSNSVWRFAFEPVALAMPFPSIMTGVPPGGTPPMEIVSPSLPLRLSVTPGRYFANSPTLPSAMSANESVETMFLIPGA